MTLFMLAAYGFICAAVYHLCPAQIRWAVLLLASYGFYASRSLAGLPFILLTTVSTWLAALVIAQIGENGKALPARMREGVHVFGCCDCETIFDRFRDAEVQHCTPV